MLESVLKTLLSLVEVEEVLVEFIADTVQALWLKIKNPFYKLQNKFTVWIKNILKSYETQILQHLNFYFVTFQI